MLLNTHRRVAARAGLAAAAVLAGLSLAGAAPAAVTVLRWSGVVEAGTDSGVFLPGGGDLTGLRFRYVARVDDATPTPLNFTTAGVITAIYGGGIYGLGAPSPLSGALSVGGVAAPATGDYFGEQTNQIDASNSWGGGHYHLSESRSESLDPTTGDHSYIDLYVIDTLGLTGISWDYHSPITLDLRTTQPLLAANGGGAAGQIAIYAPDGHGGTALASADLIVTGLTIGPAVPEPAAWLQLLAGVAAVGGALRAGRRGRRTSHA